MSRTISRQADVYIEITERMLAAGTQALEECEDYPSTSRHVVVEVLKAIYRTRARQEHVKIKIVFRGSIAKIEIEDYGFGAGVSALSGACVYVS